MTRFLVRIIVLTFGILLSVFRGEAQSMSSSKLSAHLINGYTTGSSNIVAGRPQLLKVLALDTDFPQGLRQAMRDYKAKVPFGKIVVRVYSPKMYFTNDDATWSAGDFWTNHLRPAINFLSASDKQLIDYLEGPNEGETPTVGYPYDPNDPHFSARWFNQFWTNLTPLMVAAGLKPCVGSIAVGNPGDITDLDYLVPALRQAKAAGGSWSYHAYTVVYGTDVATEMWYSLRYRQFYSYFAQHFPDLVDMPLLLTEGGVDYTGDPSTSGWQARGPTDYYQRWLNWFDYQMQQDSYLVGCTLFQNGDPSGWASFDLDVPMAGNTNHITPISGWLGNFLANPTMLPLAPTGVSGSGSGAIILTWTNVVLSPTTFNVKRATNSSGPYTLLARNIAEGVQATTYTDTSATNGVTYYYVISGVNAIGEGPNSIPLAVTPTLPMINCGGANVGTFGGDNYFNGGQSFAVTNNITPNVTSLPSAPLAVYQSQRYGDFSYIISNLPKNSYQVILHFAELFFNTAGQRKFNVSINGAKVLNQFDIVADAGRAFRVDDQAFSAVPDINGRITVQFSSVLNNATVNGIQLLINSTNVTPATPTNLTAMAGLGNVTLNWAAPAGALTFKVKRSTASGANYVSLITNLTSATYVDTAVVSGTTYYYVVSAVNGVGESVNSSEVSAASSNSLPDAIGTSLSWTPVGLTNGAHVVFNIMVKNQGGTPIAANSLGIGFQVDGQQVSYVGAGNAALSAGSSASYTANGGPAGVNYWTATPGAHTITAVVDDLNRFAEGNENNNLFSVPLVVYVTNYTINAGGTAIGNFAADNYYSGTSVTSSNSAAIDLGLATNAAPQSVYQTERSGPAIYTFANLFPGKLYKARLHFAEISPAVNQGGDRQFNVSVGGMPVLTNFDIMAATGAKFRATTRQFNMVVDSLGQIVVQLAKGVAGDPKISGMEIFPYTNTLPALAAISAKTVNSGGMLVFANSATDADIPADVLTFSLDAGAPVGATVNPATGLFSWTAPAVTTNTTNIVTMRVTDNGTPAFSNPKIFSIVVIAPPQVSSFTVSNGVANLTWQTFPGKTYRVEFKDDLNDSAWTILGSDTVAGGMTLTTLDNSGVRRFYRIVQTN